MATTPPLHLAVIVHTPTIRTYGAHAQASCQCGWLGARAYAPEMAQAMAMARADWDFHAHDMGLEVPADSPV